MKTPLFVFLGVVEKGTDANISTLKRRLEVAIPNLISESKFEEKGELLIITVKSPRFCFYISFVDNDHKTLSDWKELAKNFELLWDVKPVDQSRLSSIIVYLESHGWANYRPVLNLGHTILKEIEDFSRVKVFTIPSVGKSTFWSRLFEI
jgi:hypothetical protein